jgi:serine/threonine protein kinase/tetratricopeptide (TPR) repeat protein
MVDRLVEEFASAWERGERLPAEEFLVRFPELSEDDAVQLVYEEICLRLEAGENDLNAEFYKRFPQWRPQLAVLIECKRLLESSPRIDFPTVGDILGDFRLIAELGRGAVGRTFLARQRSLADRTVVLKVISIEHEEHLSLARLQHMNIAPLYFEHVFTERNLRVLGMPYLGGSSLARLLRTLEDVPLSERKGKDLLDALDRRAAGFPGECPTAGPIRKYLAQASFVQAICWIGASLADALQYAHERGLVHYDVKPSNVLIAGDGQPMLLDFHLAREPMLPGHPRPERLGGTPGHFSPEQKAAIHALRHGKPLTMRVDGRSDIYALGVVLYDALAGVAHEHPARVRSLERCNRNVSAGLSDVVRKCMADDPSNRYPDGASLALDLRRHLNDLPLVGVVNRSWIERWRKWRSRSPMASGRGLLRIGSLATVLVFVALIALSLYQWNRRVDAAIAEGTNHVSRGRYAEATLACKQGLSLLAGLPWRDRRVAVLEETLGRVSRAHTAAELHETVDMLHFRFGVTPPEQDEARELFHRALAVWQARERIANAFAPATDSPASAQVRADLVDLATILADLRTRWGLTEDRNAAYRVAVEILQAARAGFGPSPALMRDLQRYAHVLGATGIVAGPIPPARSAWDHFDLGRSHMRSGDREGAEREFRSAIAMQPDEFWPHFDHGICCYRLGRFHDAAASLSTAIALAPRTPESYYNRALAYQALDRAQDAIDDNTHALEIRPKFSDASLNRGVLLFRAGKLSEALDDFDRARASATSPKMLGLIRYNEALVHLARNDTTAAGYCLDEAVANGDEDARRLRDRLRPQ